MLNERVEKFEVWAMFEWVTMLEAVLKYGCKSSDQIDIDQELHDFAWHFTVFIS